MVIKIVPVGRTHTDQPLPVACSFRQACGECGPEEWEGEKAWPHWPSGSCYPDGLEAPGAIPPQKLDFVPGNLVSKGMGG